MLVYAAELFLPEIQLFFDLEAIAKLFFGLLVLLDASANVFVFIVPDQTQLDLLEVWYLEVYICGRRRHLKDADFIAHTVVLRVGRYCLLKLVAG